MGSSWRVLAATFLLSTAPAQFANSAETEPATLSNEQMESVVAGWNNWGSLNFALITQSATAVSVAGGVINIGSLNVAGASAFNFATIDQR